MNTFDVVSADQLVDGDNVLLIRQIRRETVHVPVESITVTDLDTAIKVEGLNTEGDSVVYLLMPDEDVELWHS